MTQSRSNYLYKFLGSIQKKNKRTKPEHPQYFWQLKIKLSGQSHLQKIFVFKSKTKSFIWNSLENDTYLGKTYLFSCRNYKGNYHVVDWEEAKDGK